MHFISLPWKLAFACVPPTGNFLNYLLFNDHIEGCMNILEYLGGWLCFLISIVIIGVLTALVDDAASHFGCTVGLKDEVNAISIVALGTSLPGNQFFLKFPILVPRLFIHIIR